MFGNFIEIYEAQTRKEPIKSHRGGGDVVTTLLVYGLERNIIDKALVVRMSDIEPWRAIATIAKTSKEAIEAAGSKYAFVPHGKLTRELTAKSAIVGLPCQTRARGPYFKMGLFCGLCSSDRGWNYFFKKRGIKKEDIVSLEYRVPYTRNLVIELRNGEKKELPHPYWLGFFFPYKKCLYCTDYTNHNADIAVGDIRPGWSMVLIRTRRGKDLFERALEEEYLRAHTIKLEDYLRLGGSCLLQKEIRGGYVRTKFVALRGKWIEYMPIFLLTRLGKFIAKAVK